MKQRYRMYDRLYRAEIIARTLQVAYEGDRLHHPHQIIAQMEDNLWYVFETTMDRSGRFAVTLIADRYPLIGDLVENLQKGDGHGV